MSVVETVQQICDRLVSGAVGTLEVAASLGKIVEDGGEGGEVIVRPTDRAFSEIVITREDELDEPYLIEFDLHKTGDLRVGELRSVFGDFTESPKVHWDRPAKVVFYVEPEDGPYSCAIIAQIRKKGRNLDRAVVESMTVRRDVDID
jgi:hypothetical protein